ncbi:MAG: nucleotidyl transferase AbiEii/AbiGii toxin family protein [bacterium]|nr:nucleotidyl transferase AbiEii/AbiGii toxin family protein [bacterium]
MIDKSEIEAKAKEFEIHPSNVERDYVFGWLLLGIFTTSNLKDRIFLKGGNALRKGYFANTRFSSDLDFGIPDDIAQEELLSEINKVCEFAQEKSGVVFVRDDNKVEEKFTASEAPLPDLKVYEVRVYFKGFNGEADHIRIRISMDVTRFDKVLLPLQTLKLIHPYSDATEVVCDIQCMKLEEIIATKLKCLIQRQHAPDLFDYAHSIKLLGGNLNKEEVVETLVKKTIFNRNPFILKGILNGTAFTYFRTEWAKSVICAKELVMDVEDAIATFVADLDVLFANYTDNGFAQFIYFSPEVRAKIMHAGRTQTLLKVRYQGYDRSVEPYSLKYLENKQGEAYEYFYVFNCSGGKQSTPGIRRFLPKPLEVIENTEEKFTPRVQIELSKAGEVPENPYLFDPNRPAKAPRPRSTILRTRRQSFSSSLKYKFKCSVCGKQFRRSSHDSTLRPHKGKGGYQCYGTYGVYIGASY